MAPEDGGGDGIFRSIGNLFKSKARIHAESEAAVGYGVGKAFSLGKAFLGRNYSTIYRAVSQAEVDDIATFGFRAGEDMRQGNYLLLL